MSADDHERIHHDHSHDGIDRRGFLKCMAWAGTGTLCVLQGGVLRSYAFGSTLDDKALTAQGGLAFVQISDSHMGFNNAANPDVAGALKGALDKINPLPVAPELILHTGDITQSTKPAEFDAVDQILKGASTQQIFYVPGEHDVMDGDGKAYLARYGRGSKGLGWRSFDHKGVHFIGLVNVMNFKRETLGVLGHEQLEWLEDDVKHLPASTPIVVFAHVPLWSVYPAWGWGTEDGGPALR